MHYASIKKYDVANGEGIRISLFVSGCPHHCKSCFNPEAWDYNYGKLFCSLWMRCICLMMLLKNFCNILM